MQTLLSLMGTLAAGAVALVASRTTARGLWSAGYWWSDADRRRGPGC